MEKLARHIKAGLDNGDINIHAIRTLCSKILEGKQSPQTVKETRFSRLLENEKSKSRTRLQRSNVK